MVLFVMENALYLTMSQGMLYLIDPLVPAIDFLSDFYETTGPNSKYFHRIVLHDALYHNCTNGTTPLNKRPPEL